MMTLHGYSIHQLHFIWHKWEAVVISITFITNRPWKTSFSSWSFIILADSIEGLLNPRPLQPLKKDSKDKHTFVFFLINKILNSLSHLISKFQWISADQLANSSMDDSVILAAIIGSTTVSIYFKKASFIPRNQVEFMVLNTNNLHVPYGYSQKILDYFIEELTTFQEDSQDGDLSIH